MLRSVSVLGKVLVLVESRDSSKIGPLTLFGFRGVDIDHGIGRRGWVRLKEIRVRYETY